MFYDRRVRVEYREEPCKVALNRVKGMPFDWSLNPYMGCVHRCTFCYVRGFEKRADRPSDDRYGRSIRVKVNVAELLRAQLARKSWQGEGIAIGAATDPYQPAEGRYRLTRACLDVLCHASNPFSIITRGLLIVRDVDVLAEASQRAPVSVTFSVPTVDDDVWRTTEPGTAPPRQRLRALKVLVDAGVRAPRSEWRPSSPASPIIRVRSPAWSPPRAKRAPAASGQTSSTSVRAHASTSWSASRAIGRSCSRTTSGSTNARPTCRDPRVSLPKPTCGGSRKSTEFAIAGPSRCGRSPATNSFHSFQRRIASQMADEITTMIVDDHEVVREGLRLSLSRAPHIRVVGEAADGASAVEMAERRKPDVIIMDVRMPGMDGLEATKILTEKVPESKVLIFTAYSERSLLSRGLESGAKGYILKEAPHQTLVRAIEKVAQGDGYVDPALMPAFLAGKDQTDMLTTREREILQLLADGMSNADVAGRLFISQETVKSHVRHILTKLEADTRTHAVAIALREAIID